MGWKEREKNTVHPDDVRCCRVDVSRKVDAVDIIIYCYILKTSDDAAVSHCTGTRETRRNRRNYIVTTDALCTRQGSVCGHYNIFRLHYTYSNDFYSTKFVTT